VPCCQQRHWWWNCDIDLCNKGALLGHWTKFLASNIDLYLQNMDWKQQITFLQLFAWWVRAGAARRGCQVKTSSMQALLGAIGKTIEFAGFDNPLQNKLETNIYHAVIAMQTETYWWADPVTKKHVAVLVQVCNHIYNGTRQTNNHRLKAVGKLTLIEFLFLAPSGGFLHITEKVLEGHNNSNFVTWNILSMSTKSCQNNLCSMVNR